MKKALEAALVVAALFLSVFVFYRWRLRQELAARPASPATHPGEDVENPGAAWAPRGAVHPVAVTSLPSIRISSSPKPVRRRIVVP